MASQSTIDRITPYEHQKAKLSRALEKRFGKSLLPHLYSPLMASGTWRCKDLESGAYIDGRFAGGRLYVIGEHGPDR